MPFSKIAIAALITFGTASASGSTPTSTGNAAAGSDAAHLMPDPAFGDGGSTTVAFNDADGSNDQALRAFAADDGGYWVAGMHPTAERDRFALAKLTADGQPDPAWGDAGKRIVDTGLVSIVDVASDGAGHFYLAGHVYPTAGGAADFGAACVDVDGIACAGFGDDGMVRLPFDLGPTAADAPTRIGVHDSAVYIIGQADKGTAVWDRNWVVAVAKIDALTGTPAADFGNLPGQPGYFALDLERFVGGPSHSADLAFSDVDGHARLLVVGNTRTTSEFSTDAFILAIDRDSGMPDAAFGENGVRYVGFLGGAHVDKTTAESIRVLDDHSLVVAGNYIHDDEDYNETPEVMLAAFSADGTPLAAFGDGGAIHHAIGYRTEVTALVVRHGGDLVVAMQSEGLLPDAQDPFSSQSIVQFSPDGLEVVARNKLQFPLDSESSPVARPTSAFVDDGDRIVLAGISRYEAVSNDFDFTASRLLAPDTVFADGFEGTKQARRQAD